jgi:hypothetical protein
MYPYGLTRWGSIGSAARFLASPAAKYICGPVLCARHVCRNAATAALRPYRPSIHARTSLANTSLKEALIDAGVDQRGCEHAAEVV